MNKLLKKEAKEEDVKEEETVRLGDLPGLTVTRMCLECIIIIPS
ncbi:MAG: hypothetical protein WD068_02635 [Candidatus Babeliales bacterium]